MSILRLNLRSAIGDTGDHVERTEVYEAERHGDASFSFWQMYESKDPHRPGWVRGSMGWSGFASVIEFTADRQREVDRWAATALKHRVEAEAARVRAEIAQGAVDAIRAAFDLSDRQWEWKLWGEVGEAAGQSLPDFLAEATALLKPEQRLLAIRKLLRPLLTDAKGNLREEYPEAYREEEDKDDFYADYLSDLVGFIVLDVEQPQ